MNNILKNTMISIALILMCANGHAGENKTVMPGKTVSDLTSSMSEALVYVRNRGVKILM